MYLTGKKWSFEKTISNLTHMNSCAWLLHTETGRIHTVSTILTQGHNRFPPIFTWFNTYPQSKDIHTRADTGGRQGGVCPPLRNFRGGTFPPWELSPGWVIQGGGQQKCPPLSVRGGTKVFLVGVHLPLSCLPVYFCFSSPSISAYLPVYRASFPRL